MPRTKRQKQQRAKRRKNKKQRRYRPPGQQHTDSYRAYLASPEWRRKRWAALQHHGRHCGVCRTRHNLHVHHKTYARLFRELMDDLEILCEECHRMHHGIILPYTTDELGQAWRDALHRHP